MHHTQNREIVFVAAKRTPFGTFGGSLKKMTATELGVHASKAALTQCTLFPNDIDQIIFGNVLQTSKDAIYLARHIGLHCEVPHEKPALVVNRLCGSGFEAIILGAQQLKLGEADCVLVGGSESMSQAPHVVRGARWGIPLGQSKLEDSLWESLTDSYTKMSMAITAENLAQKYHISQHEVDHYSLLSQQRYAQAKLEERFAAEMAPITLKSRKESLLLENDEHPRPQTTLEGLAKLPKVFKKDGVIHAGAASGICDGAAALIMCTKSFAESKNLKPIGKFVNYATVGCNPEFMGIGPSPAITALLSKTQKKTQEIDIFEINEAFAPQVLAVIKELGLDTERVNLDGGAIALGHPLAASGARIVAHLLYALRQRGVRQAIGSACIGGGQGTAVMIESID